jgi:hypothetical protein
MVNAFIEMVQEICDGNHLFAFNLLFYGVYPYAEVSLSRSYATTLRNHDGRRSMPGEYMNTALFFNACLFLVPCEYSVQATLSPYLPIVDVK